MREKLNALLSRNPGWTTIKTVAGILKWKDTPIRNDLNGLTPADIAELKILPVVNIEIEKSYSTLKMTRTGGEILQSKTWKKHR